jgi:hypothetical protein
MKVNFRMSAVALAVSMGSFGAAGVASAQSAQAAPSKTTSRASPDAGKYSPDGCAYGEGTPGTVSFTATISASCTNAQARAYCKYYDISSGYGSVLTDPPGGGIYAGSSKATCSGITQYGFQERQKSSDSWDTVDLGSRGS